MPNNIQNALKLKGEKSEIKKVLEYIKEKNASIDFNKIIKCPESLNVESSSIGELGYFALTGRVVNFFTISEEATKRYNNLSKEYKKEADKLGKIYKSNFEKYGFTTWYEWSYENWGTKWNAYETPDKRDTEDTIYFQTAWSGVPKLIEKLSLKFPLIEFNYMWADEDTGYNVGAINFKIGITEKIEIISGSTDAFKLAFFLWPGTKEEYKFIDGKYIDIEEFDEPETIQKISYS